MAKIGNVDWRVAAAVAMNGLAHLRYDLLLLRCICNAGGYIACILTDDTGRSYAHVYESKEACNWFFEVEFTREPSVQEINLITQALLKVNFEDIKPEVNPKRHYVQKAIIKSLQSLQGRNV